MNNTRIHAGGLVALLCILGASACGPATNEPSSASIDPNAKDWNKYYIFKDKETGCDYLVVATSESMRAGVAITPRLWSDGVQICRDASEK